MQVRTSVRWLARSIRSPNGLGQSCARWLIAVAAVFGYHSALSQVTPDFLSACVSVTFISTCPMS